MKVAAVLPQNTGTPIEILRQEVEGAKAHFPAEVNRLEFFAPQPAVERYRQMFPDIAISALPPRFTPETHVVMLEAYDRKAGFTSDYDVVQLAHKAKAPLSSIKFYGRIMPYDRPWSEAELQNMGSHVFNRLSPEAPWGFYYFPYGYLFRFLGMGPINAIGCRITHSLSDLAKRPKNKKVVACFGGSAGWSMYCLHHQMYTEVIQRKLNAHCAAENLDIEFTVLNFGQHGHMVMNEMLTYLTFCWDLKPDIVIAHDGYNDAVYGQMCDPRLVDEWDVTYQENLEGWSQILHQTSDQPRTQNELPYRAVNQPVRVLRAYTRRKRQFAQIVQSNGGFFIWGLQPAACSRKKKSPLEAELLERNLNRDYAPVVSNVEGMYRILGASLKLGADIPFVNCHEAVGAYGPDHFLLGDDVHLMPEGDEIIASLYADTIISNYIGQGRC